MVKNSLTTGRHTSSCSLAIPFLHCVSWLTEQFAVFISFTPQFWHDKHLPFFLFENEKPWKEQELNEGEYQEWIPRIRHWEINDVKLPVKQSADSAKIFVVSWREDVKRKSCWSAQVEDEKPWFGINTCYNKKCPCTAGWNDFLRPLNNQNIKASIWYYCCRSEGHVESAECIKRNIK